jgi:hypothetical protein
LFKAGYEIIYASFYHSKSAWANKLPILHNYIVFALQAIKKGASPETIAYILGYENISTAEIYIDLVKRGIPTEP